MKVLLIGGTGLIGSTSAEELIRRGLSRRGLSLTLNPLPRRPAHHQQLSLLHRRRRPGDALQQAGVRHRRGYIGIGWSGPAADLRQGRRRPRPALLLFLLRPRGRRGRPPPPTGRQGPPRPPPQLASAEDFPSLPGGSVKQGGRDAKLRVDRPTPLPGNGGADFFRAATAVGAPKAEGGGGGGQLPIWESAKKDKAAQEALKRNQAPPDVTHDEYPSLGGGRQRNPAPKEGDDAALLDMLKVQLGQDGYKQLKKLTKEYAASALPGDRYIAGSAALFAGRGGGGGASSAGLAFRNLMPMLVEGMPEHLRSPGLLALIDSVGGQIEEGATFASAAAPPGFAKAFPPPLAPPASSAARPAPPRTGGAWGAGGPPPASKVSAGGEISAVAVELRQATFRDTGTATKAMADLKKKERAEAQRAQEAGQAGDAAAAKKGDKKKKEKNELRELAFGKM